MKFYHNLFGYMMCHQTDIHIYVHRYIYMYAIGHDQLMLHVWWCGVTSGQHSMLCFIVSWCCSYMYNKYTSKLVNKHFQVTSSGRNLCCGNCNLTRKDFHQDCNVVTSGVFICIYLILYGELLTIIQLAKYRNNIIIIFYNNFTNHNLFSNFCSIILLC